MTDRCIRDADADPVVAVAARRGRQDVLPPALACAVGAVLFVSMSPLRMVAAPQSGRAQSAWSSTVVPGIAH